jgi:hypothetical protein
MKGIESSFPYRGDCLISTQIQRSYPADLSFRAVRARALHNY